MVRRTLGIALGLLRWLLLLATAALMLFLIGVIFIIILNSLGLNFITPEDLAEIPFLNLLLSWGMVALFPLILVDLLVLSIGSRPRHP